MKNVIFSKYSNDRSRDFKIRTDILEDETGRRYARKVGMTEAGREHLAQVHDLSQRMKDLYEHTIFEINRSEYADGILELEYIEGRTLEDILDSCLKEKRLDRFRDFLSVYAGEMRKLADTEFVPDQSYYAIFGEDAFAAPGKKSARISNIDVIFPNLIENGSCWTVLDAEWTFEVLVPVDYILFRAAHYYVTPRRQKQMGDLDVYALLGVDSAECETYQKMEQNFQQFVCANNVPLWRLYGTMGKKCYFPAGMVEERHIRDIRSRVRVIFYTGEDYQECEVPVPEDAQDVIAFELPVVRGCDTVRIDPGYAPCAVYVEEVTGITNPDEYGMAYGVNGESSDNRLIFFDTDTPQILTNDIREGLQRIRVRFARDFTNRKLTARLCDKSREFNDMRCEDLGKDKQILDQNDRIEKLNAESDAKSTEILQARKELERLHAELEQRNIELEQMHNSASWKLTEPARKLKAHIGRKV